MPQLEIKYKRTDIRAIERTMDQHEAIKELLVKIGVVDLPLVSFDDAMREHHLEMWKFRGMQTHLASIIPFGFP